MTLVAIIHLKVIVLKIKMTSNNSINFLIEILKIKGSHGLYWDISSDNTICANSTVSNKFSIELLPNNKMLIKGPNGCYLKGEQNGNLTSNVQDPKLATQWEF